MGNVFKTNRFAEFIVRRATEKDLRNIHEMFIQIAKDLKKKGIRQWESYLNGGGKEEVRRDILAENTYVIENDAKHLVASFTFSNRQNDWDEKLWGKRHDDAFYLHRLAVNENFRHQQIGKRLLQWIDENNTIKSGFIRLDCVGNNGVLNKFYQRAGYTFIKYYGVGDDRFSLFEKQLYNSKA